MRREIRPGNRSIGGMPHEWAAFIKVVLYILVPTLGGILIGIRLDRDETFFWTLVLMVAGIVLGAVLAWYSIQIERRHQREHGE